MPSGAAVRVFGDSLADHWMRWNVIFREGKWVLMLERAVGGGGKAQTIRRWSWCSEDPAEPEEMQRSPIVAVGFMSGCDGVVVRDGIVRDVEVSCEDSCWIRGPGEDGEDGWGMCS